MRFALGAQPRERPGRILSQQRPMRLRGGAANEFFVGSINVDDRVPRQELPNCGSCCRSPAQGHDGLVRERLGDCFGLHHAKGCFAVGCKNIRNRTAIAFDDESIGIDVVDTQVPGEEAPDLGFASAGQADENDWTAHAHARSPTAAR